jgi:hypothetical protein
MTQHRYDETWHRLQEWTKGQSVSERLAAQILLHEGFLNFDPSHPLGGQDGGTDATATKDGKPFVMAVYFPRGQQSFRETKNKFEGDLRGAINNDGAIAFVTNQELRLAEREELRTLAEPTIVELYHLERIAAILDKPEMAQVRRQFLDVEAGEGDKIINLGGQGGSAPGAGGGGGTGIGAGATGGPGGPGGDTYLHGVPGTKTK